MSHGIMISFKHSDTLPYLHNLTAVYLTINFTDKKITCLYSFCFKHIKW